MSRGDDKNPPRGSPVVARAAGGHIVTEALWRIILPGVASENHSEMMRDDLGSSARKISYRDTLFPPLM